MQTKLKKETDSYFFYLKNQNKKIVPHDDPEFHMKAKDKLGEIHEKYKKNLPKRFITQWEDVKLYHPKGNLEEANSLIINPEEGAYDPENKLNNLTGKEWTKFSCSWFIFNALQKDLKEEKEITKDTADHPATYSPTMMEDFIKFFTKEGMKVLDPFAGIGSTLVGSKRTGRIGYGIELNKKYFDAILKRVPEFANNVVNGDARKVKEIFKNEKFNFCISSPPYWDVLNRSTDGFKKMRENKNLDYTYSNKSEDLGNIENYQLFLQELASIYLDIYDLLYDGAYIVVIVKNIKKQGKLYPLAWDLAKLLEKKYVLKDEKIWIQDKISLAPYGYPNSWASNILHHYCIILRKEDKDE